MESARDHPILEMVQGRVCHLTTPSNFRSIMSDGLIKAETTRNGLFVRRDGAASSVCMSYGAVSVFDFGVSWESLTPLYPDGEEAYSYDLNWWSFFNLGTEAIIIMLDDSVRNTFVSDPEGRGQFIRGAEYCHDGDISSDRFAAFVLRTGNLRDPRSYSIKRYEVGEHDVLLEDARAWATRLDFVRSVAHELIGKPIEIDDLRLLEMETMLPPLDDSTAA